ncbi:bifunctional acetyl-CoA hydrolase/transferase family protein/GNAT family N-acetyltransferase [Desulfosalsimonas propionicica]|nr:bifunctional acetyl-CoA hydrolase/transferase family protein/GNAT family N-acetyltransferase [Desulfosalsimonas propionicica]
MENWEKHTVSPEKVLARIEPGMCIFLSTGTAEPRTLVRHLMDSDMANLQDLELFQLLSFGDALCLKRLQSQKYRLKTFFSGWVAREAITEGRVDLIPSRFSRLTRLVASRRIPFDAAFVQISPPNRLGYCSLGVSVDIAHMAISQAGFVAGEINPDMPQTMGDSFVPMDAFDMLVKSDEAPIYFSRAAVDENFDKVAQNAASLVEDGSCIAFSIGPLYEALGRHLQNKKNLSIHTPIFTDAAMDLVKSGAVTNRNKEHFPGKSVASYAMGTRELWQWLDCNPLVEFQGLDKVFNPMRIGRDRRFIAIVQCRRADLTGRIALHVSKGNVITDPAEVIDFFNGAEISEEGFSIFALPSRNLKGQSNILFSIEEMPNQLNVRESIDFVATEYGVANLNGRTVRERAMAMIEIAHPDDRFKLVEEAKAQNLIYPDQIFLAESAHLYPADIETVQVFKNDLKVRFRPLRPSDEEEMRRLFYRFSDESVYYRYFTPLKTMPHSRMQSYVNVDYSKDISIVGVVGEPGQGRIIAEARYIKDPHSPYGDVAFIVDEHYQGYGIATYMYQKLMRLAKERGLQGFTADVMPANKSMMRVFEKGDAEVKAALESGIYRLTIRFHE